MANQDVIHIPIRPGRFGQVVEVPLPSLAARQEILEIHSRKLDLDVELQVGARDWCGVVQAMRCSSVVTPVKHHHTIYSDTPSVTSQDPKGRSDFLLTLAKLSAGLSGVCAIGRNRLPY